jgi:hypothetical protein
VADGPLEPTRGSVGRGDVEVASALEVGLERETYALGDVTFYRG